MLDLERFARALRLRWLWHEWVSPRKDWVGTEFPCDATDILLLFAACTQITIGNGKKTSFWSSGWVNGCRPRDLAPNLFSISRGKRKTVAEAIAGDAWIGDIRPRNGLTITHLLEFCQLWEHVQKVRLIPDQEDQIRWKFMPTGIYTAASAYKAQFIGCTKATLPNALRRTWAPPKYKFFVWLITQNRVWTSDRLARRGWPHSPSCPLCLRVGESAHHLLSECRYTRRIWQLAAEWVALPELNPNEWRPSDSAQIWWLNIATMAGVPKKAVRSLAMLIIWEVWKEQNNRVFNRQETSAIMLMEKIKTEIGTWITAGAKDLLKFYSWT